MALPEHSNGYFPVTYLHRDDFKGQYLNRFDDPVSVPLDDPVLKAISELPDSYMIKVANKIANAIMEDYWFVVDYWLDELVKEVED